MLDRRRLLIANSQGGGDGYVTNGLVLFLDGLNQGNVTDKWVDVVNGYEFDLNNATKNSNYVSFNNGYAKDTDKNVAYYSNPVFTIEFGIVPRSLSNYMNIISVYRGRERTVSKNYTLITWGGQSGAITTPYHNGVLTCYSAIFDQTSYTNIKENNQTPSITYQGGEWGSNEVLTGVGSYPNWTYLGDCYFVRIYNRILSDEERTQNYQTDKARFNI